MIPPYEEHILAQFHDKNKEDYGNGHLGELVDYYAPMNQTNHLERISSR